MQTPSPSVLNNYAVKPVSHPLSSILRRSSFCFAEFQPINRIVGILIVALRQLAQSLLRHRRHEGRRVVKSGQALRLELQGALGEVPYI